MRRIEAVTGAGALDYLRRLEDELLKTGERLKAQPFEVAQRVDKLLADQKALDREIEKLKQRLASGGGGRDLLSEAVTIKGIKVLAAAIEVDDAKVLRDTGDQLRDKLGSGVVVLAGTGGGEVKLVAMVTKDLVGKVARRQAARRGRDAARRPRGRPPGHGAGRRQGCRGGARGARGRPQVGGSARVACRR